VTERPAIVVDMTEDPVVTEASRDEGGRIPGDALGAGVPEKDAAPGVDDVDTVRDVLEGPAKEVVAERRDLFVNRRLLPAS
jgi:hypothetical protein